MCILQRISCTDEDGDYPGVWYLYDEVHITLIPSDVVRLYALGQHQDNGPAAETNYMAIYHITSLVEKVSLASSDLLKHIQMDTRNRSKISSVPFDGEPFVGFGFFDIETDCLDVYNQTEFKQGEHIDDASEVARQDTAIVATGKAKKGAAKKPRAPATSLWPTDEPAKGPFPTTTQSEAAVCRLLGNSGKKGAWRYVKKGPYVRRRITCCVFNNRTGCNQRTEEMERRDGNGFYVKLGLWEHNHDETTNNGKTKGLPEAIKQICTPTKLAGASKMTSLEFVTFVSSSHEAKDMDFKINVETKSQLYSLHQRRMKKFAKTSGGLLQNHGSWATLYNSIEKSE